MSATVVYELRVRTPLEIDVTLHVSYDSAMTHYREECMLWPDEDGKPKSLRHKIKRKSVLDRTRSEVRQ